MLRLAAILALAAPAGPQTFLPISRAIHIAEAAARARGYRLADDRRYFFDLTLTRDGRPSIAGATTLGFYWDGDLIETIVIDEASGVAVDATGCHLLDDPTLRRFRTGPPAAATLARLREATGCDALPPERAAIPRHGPHRR